jgi:hypothetical protein
MMCCQFVLIVCELVVGAPVFPKTLPSPTVAKILVAEDFRRDIFNFVLLRVKRLIFNCWKSNLADRLSVK